MNEYSARQIPNDELTLDRIPASDSSRSEIERFALTVDGYKLSGSFEACAGIAGSTGKKTLTELRITLFFKQRARRFVGLDDLDQEDILAEDRELIRQIREMVDVRQLE